MRLHQYTAVFAFASAIIPSAGSIIPDLFFPIPPPAHYTPSLYPLLFPLGDYAGAFVGPLLEHLIGDKNLELLDTLADFFCVAAGADPSGGGGVCQNILEGLYHLAIAVGPFAQSEAYKRLLAAACLAPNTSPPMGTCQGLFELADCTANRILQVKDVECNGETEIDTYLFVHNG